MKKYSLILLFALMCSVGFPQRFEVVTSDPNIPFKRHYSYSIEQGYRDGQPRQVVAGNQTDWLVNSKDIKGNAINGAIFSPGRGFELTNETANILLTDFIVTPDGENSQFAAGTGIYFPSGPTGVGYVFLGIYERETMQLTYLVYFDLLYSYGVQDRGNTAGTRIKYSASQDAYYISGIMVDRTFVGMNINNLDCYSQGFIMKVTRPYTLANVVVFDPDPLPDPKLARMCSVNDIEIFPDENAVVFTGVNTESEFPGYYHPMVGRVNMDLGLEWCYIYEFPGLRYSGIDIEVGVADETYFVLCNSEERPFAIMELGQNGLILQPPEKYTFGIPDCSNPISDELPAIARGHIMHNSIDGGLIVTGNSYILSPDGNYYQGLFSYNIPVAGDLGNGDPWYGTYSCDPVPLGSQRTLTSWWAPENSLYRKGNLYIVGSYNPNDGSNTYGYNYIDVSGFDISDPHCYLTGTVGIEGINTHQMKKPAFNIETKGHKMEGFVYAWDPEPNQECPPADVKSTLSVGEKGINGNSIWKYEGIDKGGIHAILYAETPGNYQISVFDVTGKKIISKEYYVNGQKSVYLKFNPGNQLYMISVNNGIKSESLKVFGVR